MRSRSDSQRDSFPARHGPDQMPPSAGADQGLWPSEVRLSLLPVRVRVYLAGVFVLLLAPSGFALFAELVDLEGTTLAGQLGRHSALLVLAGLVFTAALTLAFEPPRSPSARAYLGQLRTLLLDVQQDH